MGQFKPMVKMMTTEPTVELKLKKGGHVSMPKMKSGGSTGGHKKMADGGGALSAIAGTPALVGRPAVNAPVRTPGKPSMAQRRKAMAATPMSPMKKGGKAEGGESKAEHKAEMSKMKGLEKELKSHESKPASKAHKGLKTGGVANGQGGYKAGGIINTENQGGEYRNTKMHDAEKTTKTSGVTGGVKKGNGGGYKTGGVALGNDGGYKAGGKAKKAYATGGKVEDSGRPVAMPQGRKKPSTPVSINQLSGTFKKGGSVTPAEGRLQKAFAAENKTAMKQAKAQSNEVYSKYGKMKMAGGGSTEDLSNGAYDAHYANEKKENESMRSMILDPLKNLGRHVMRSFDPEGYFKGDERKKLFETQARMGLADRIKQNRAGQGAVTETERSVTVSPGKKRGGRC